MAAAITLKLIIPSKLVLVELVDTVTERAAALAGFGHGESLDLALAVREAVVNAIQHGNASDPGKNVDIAFEIDENRLRARIRDRGEGFDPAETPDPTSGSHVLEPFGRGILLMRAIVDEVSFRRRKGRGMEVILTKGKEPPAA